ncbi:uncharacterized protein N7515_000061 [Penicillium bovifimosum]|uniref:Uncharacterized protein n=1 Tax=Penicillium bovifimosum TaxID=126998 RepID=A0A9W9LAS2_9EURO|nr:uncharacterized protein N7515_000061 [Penicillium bovifimosum]KAJ5145497.1 hypothetical protein N7515_000061 [Penicillium bovifimosum]
MLRPSRVAMAESEWEALSSLGPLGVFVSRTIQHPDSQVNRLYITPDKRSLAAAGPGAGHNNVKLLPSNRPIPIL